MNTRTLLVSGMLLALTVLTVKPVFAELGTQLTPFFFPDGTEVVTATGEPDDAVLNRFFYTPNEKILVQLMTQHLNPGEKYDIWLEGSNDGIDSFSWWVGRAKANARGDLNASVALYVGNPNGPAFGSFENPRARANVVIKSISGVTMQTAYFPEF